MVCVCGGPSGSKQESQARRHFAPLQLLARTGDVALLKQEISIPLLQLDNGAAGGEYAEGSRPATENAAR